MSEAPTLIPTPAETPTPIPTPANCFPLAPGPHPRRDLSLMARGGPRGMAAGAARTPTVIVLLASFLSLSPVWGAAENARQLVEEVQKRTTAKSHRYEGLLQVFDAKGTI